MKSAGKARSNGLYRHIRTSKEIIRNLLNDYNEIVNKIMSEFQENEIYFLTESDVRNIAKKCLKSSAEVNEFIMQLRKMAYSYRYNKIGNKADEMPRDILLARGYYKTEDKGKSGMV